MNWKEQPHLFANGKFHIDAELLTSIKGDIYEFDGFVGEIIGIKNDHNGEIIDHIQLNPNDCTLLARKIEDMTDEELVKASYEEWAVKDNVENLINSVKNKRKDHIEFVKRNVIVNGHYKAVDMFLYLLSIGVYPFDQCHFEDGTVTDIKTL